MHQLALNHRLRNVSNDFLFIYFRTEMSSVSPYKPNGNSHDYQLDQSISVLRVVGWYFSFLFKF